MRLTRTTRRRTRPGTAWPATRNRSGRTGPSTRAGTRYTAAGARGLEDAVRAPDPAAAGPRLRGLRRGHAAICRSAPTQIPDFRRLSDVLMQRTGWQVVAVPGWCPTRCSSSTWRTGAFPPGSFIRKPRRARLPGRARRLPRRLRPRADADEPGHRRLHPGLRRGRPARAAAGQAATSWRASTGTRSSSACCSRPTACASTARASPRRAPRAMFALDDPSPNRIALRPRAGDAHALPHRRLPGDAIS